VAVLVVFLPLIAAAVAGFFGRAIGDREGEALALHTLANGLVYTFNIAQAGSYYRRALELYERIGHRVGLASIFVDLGLFHTELGLLDRGKVCRGADCLVPRRGDRLDDQPLVL